MNQVVLRLLHGALLLLASSVFAAQSSAQSIDIPLTPDRLVHSQVNFKIPEAHPPIHNFETMDFLGRSAFHLARGLVYAPGVEFRNGSIDVDMAADAETHFVGVAFRIESEDEYEVIFFRPGGSGTTQAIQYTPGIKGANIWQIYTGPGYTAAADIPRNQWIHLRIVVTGLVAKLFLNHSSEPALVVADLKRRNSKGSIGFWGHMGGGYFSNLRYTPDNATYPTELRQNFLTGALADWSLSEVFDVVERSPETYPNPAKLRWEKVAAENPGLIVINRYRRSPNIDSPEREDRLRGYGRGAKFVYARTTIHADRDELRKLELGYSDEIVVFLNGNPVYAANNSLGFRQPNFLGLLDPEGDTLYLPLHRGENELLLAVTEYFGGWGFSCRMVPAS
jgi:hypothetical protein